MKKILLYVFGILFIITGFKMILEDFRSALTGFAIGAGMIYWARKPKNGKIRLKRQPQHVDNTNVKANQIVHDFISDYVVLDFETTGLDPERNEIIEIGAIKIRNDKLVDQYSTLVKPSRKITPEITAINGITNEMVKNSPRIQVVISQLINFIGDDIILGHNINFDIGFLNAACTKNKYALLNNGVVDTYRLSKKLVKDINSYKLTSLAKYFNFVATNAHRALSDCETTYKLYLALKKYAEANHTAYSPSGRKKTLVANYEEIAPTVEQLSTSHILYGKIIVFTGVLDSMTREEAVQRAVNCGAICARHITKKTNYLVLGSNDFAKNVKNGISNNQLKAEEYIDRGIDIKIINEYEFINLTK